MRVLRLIHGKPTHFFREGLEAALIVGILLGYLKRSGRATLNRFAWAGVAAAVVVSMALAFVIRAVGAELEGTAEQLFEGVTLLIAIGVVTGMIFWMQRHARALKTDLESSLGAAVMQGSGWGIASLHRRRHFQDTFWFPEPAIARIGADLCAVSDSDIFWGAAMV